MIYLDHAATTPLPEAVADTMYDVLRHQFGNPSAQYPLGREAKELVDNAPKPVKEGVSKEEADKIVAAFKEVGAEMEVK